MEAINIHQAKTNLSHLLSRVELGEEVLFLTSLPITKLVPFRTLLNRRSSLGQDRDGYCADDFNASLPEDILKASEAMCS